MKTDLFDLCMGVSILILCSALAAKVFTGGC